MELKIIIENLSTTSFTEIGQMGNTGINTLSGCQPQGLLIGYWVRVLAN
jgi:hypothetical protein